jgi:hypothetical protein
VCYLLFGDLFYLFIVVVVAISNPFFNYVGSLPIVLEGKQNQQQDSSPQLKSCLLNNVHHATNRPDQKTRKKK